MATPPITTTYAKAAENTPEPARRRISYSGGDTMPMKTEDITVRAFVTARVDDNAETLIELETLPESEQEQIRRELTQKSVRARKSRRETP
jgi:hypothetical protein